MSNYGLATPSSNIMYASICPRAGGQAEAGIAKLDDPAKAEAEEEDGSKWVYDMHMVSGGCFVVGEALSRGAVAAVAAAACWCSPSLRLSLLWHPSC